MFSSGFDRIIRVFPLPVLGVLLLFEGLGLMALISLSACRSSPPVPDTILVNGQITTLDDAHREVSALAISGGRLTAVGTDAEVLRAKGSHSRVIDLEDGYLAIAMTPIPRLAELLDIPALAPYGRDPKSWFTERDAIKRLIAEKLVTATTDHWLSILEPADIWCAKVLDWPALLAMMTINPARLLGIDRHGYGMLRVGGPADITVIDPDLPWTIDSREFASAGRNCPFDGWTVRGRAVAVIVGGAIKLARRPVAGFEAARK